MLLFVQQLQVLQRQMQMHIDKVKAVKAKLEILLSNFISFISLIITGFGSDSDSSFIHRYVNERDTPNNLAKKK